jgi:competence protein ComEC
VLRIVAADHSILLTGDVENAAEAEMLEAGVLGGTDIVVMPHHGSRTSSSERFVQAVSARWSLCPAGWRNRWGFPKRDVVERWQAGGARVLETATTGAIEFSLAPSAALPEPCLHRPASRRFWHSD